MGRVDGVRDAGRQEDGRGDERSISGEVGGMGRRDAG